MVPHPETTSTCSVKKTVSIDTHQPINHKLPVRLLQSLRIVQVMNVGVKVYVSLVAAERALKLCHIRHLEQRRHQVGLRELRSDSPDLVSGLA
jgi:hypothetical protein